ncbi:uncharacterized protein METZ01_LOCUS480700, partial [marine metagenome]
AKAAVVPNETFLFQMNSYCTQSINFNGFENSKHSRTCLTLSYECIHFSTASQLNAKAFNRCLSSKRIFFIYL